MLSGFLASSKSFLADVHSTVLSVLDDEKAAYEAEKARMEAQRAAAASQTAKERSREGVALWSVWGTSGAAAAKEREKELQAKILKLSLDRRTFLAPAPDESAFAFSFESAWPLAQFALRLDPKLERARFLLVPRKLTEQQFWRNYLYRVESIRHTAKVDSIFDMPEEEAQRRKKIAADNMPLAKPAAATAAAGASAAATSSGKATTGAAARPGATKPADDVSRTHTLR